MIQKIIALPILAAALLTLNACTSSTSGGSSPAPHDSTVVVPPNSTITTPSNSTIITH